MRSDWLGATIPRAGFIELRVIRQEAPPFQEFFHATELGAAASRAVGLRRPGGRYFGPRSRERELGTKEAIAVVPVLFADLDDEAAEASLHQLLSGQPRWSRVA